MKDHCSLDSQTARIVRETIFSTADIGVALKISAALNTCAG
jgi:hypothetical protein